MLVFANQSILQLRPVCKLFLHPDFYRQQVLDKPIASAKLQQCYIYLRQNLCQYALLPQKAHLIRALTSWSRRPMSENFHIRETKSPNDQRIHPSYAQHWYLSMALPPHRKIIGYLPSFCLWPPLTQWLAHDMICLIVQSLMGMRRDATSSMSREKQSLPALLIYIPMRTAASPCGQTWRGLWARESPLALPATAA